MKGNYSQLKAMLAITKGSLKAVFRSPSAVIFSIAFPLIFILVFGFLGNSGKVSINVAFDAKRIRQMQFMHPSKTSRVSMW